MKYSSVVFFEALIIRHHSEEKLGILCQRWRSRQQPTISQFALLHVKSFDGRKYQWIALPQQREKHFDLTWNNLPRKIRDFQLFPSDATIRCDGRVAGRTAAMNQQLENRDLRTVRRFPSIECVACGSLVLDHHHVACHYLFHPTEIRMIC